MRVMLRVVSDSSGGGKKGFGSGYISRLELIGFSGGFNVGSEKKWEPLVMPRVLALALR